MTNIKPCIIVLGPPGSGKGTQAQMLADAHGWTHIEIGALLRSEHAEMDAMNAGNLVSREAVLRSLEEKLNKSSLSSGIVLDGAPRAMDQKRVIEDILHTCDFQVQAVVILNVSSEELLRRVEERMICANCGKQFSTQRIGRSVGDACPDPECGGLLGKRAEDSPEKFATRMKVFEQETLPVIEAYRNERIPTFEIDASRSPEEVSQEIVKVTREYTDIPNYTFKRE